MKASWLERLRRAWRAFGARALDAVYPPVCHLCGAVEAGSGGVCAVCEESLPGLAEPFCERCGEEFDGRIEGPFACPNCRGQKFHFEFARAGLTRSGGAMKLIHDLKYGRHLELAPALGRLAARALEDGRVRAAAEAGWPLVPVPLHRGRERGRHFNQAREIARELGGQGGLEVEELLRRVKRTGTQTRLTRAKRLKNLRGAFQAGPEAAGREGVILVDDVFTTGATVNECARTLRRAGVQKVIVVTVMRG